MRNLKEILKDLKVTINVKNDVSYSKRVYVHACNTPEEQNKFNLVADIRISSSLSFEKLEEGSIKKGQRTELFIFELLDAVLGQKNYLTVNEETEYNYRKYLNKELTLKGLKKVLHIKSK